MKKIDKNFSHLPEEDAIAATKALHNAQTQPELRAAFLKEEEKTQKYRDEFVRQDRRSFLDIVAKSGIAAGLLKTIPLLGGVMSARHAMAQDLTNKRVVFLYLNSGAIVNTFLPSSASVMNQATTKYGPGEGNYNVADLCNFRTLNVVTGGHESMTNSLGAPRGEVTVDKRIADAYAASTTGVATLRHVYLGVGGKGRACSSFGTGVMKDLTQGGDGKYGTQAEAEQIVKDVFGGGVVPPNPTDNTGQLAYNAQLRAIASIKNRLSTEEAIRLEEHTATLNKIKANMVASSSSSGNPVAACQSPAAAPGAHFVDGGKRQADIIVAALACGITKVATLQLGTEQAAWRGFQTRYTQDHHGAAHSTNGDTGPFIELNRYANEVPAYLIHKLRTTMGPDMRPLIETTVFVQVTCMGSGFNHSPDNAPFVVATQMEGFRRGFSASPGAGVYDLANTIPMGLKIPGITYPGSNTMGLLT